MLVVSDLYLFEDMFFWILPSNFLEIAVIFYRQCDYWDIKFVDSKHEIYYHYVHKYISFVQDKPISTSQFIKDESRDLQKLLRYLSRIVTYTCNVHILVVVLVCLCILDFQVAAVSLVFLLLFSFYAQMIYHLKRYHISTSTS